VIGKGKQILPEDLPFYRKEEPCQPQPKSLRAMEKLHIERILDETGWNIRQAARVLEIDRQTLYNKMRRYRIEPRR